MQLRKVCNHPNLFEPRPIISPLQTSGFPYMIPSLVWNMNDDAEEKVFYVHNFNFIRACMLILIYLHSTFQTVTHNFWNLTKNELSLDKRTAKKVRMFAMKNYCLNVRHTGGTAIMESTSFPNSAPRTESFRNVIDLTHAADKDIVIPMDGDEDCSIIFEHKNDPTTVRRTMYSFQKSVVPIPPRLRTPLAIFTMDQKPPESLLQDREFISALVMETEAETPPPPPSQLPSSKVKACYHN